MMDDDRVEDTGGATTTLRATLCGRTTLSAHGQTLGPRQLGGAKPRHILMALLLRVGQPVTKAQLVEHLWGDAPPAGALSTLEGYASLLRKRLEPLHPGQESPVRTVPGGYLADPALIDVDTHRFHLLCDAARRPGRPRAQALQDYTSALHVVEGGLLPDERAQLWLDEERRNHEATVGRVMVEAAALALEADEPGLAEHWARTALDRDAFDETAWRVLLESLEVRGQHADGVRAYDSCRRLFAKELGCAPGPGIRAAFSRLLAGTQQSDEAGLGSVVQALLRVYAEASPPRPSMAPSASGANPTALEDACRVLDSLLVAARANYRLRLVASA